MRKNFKLTFLLAAILLFAVSCSINESEEPEEGFLFVSATDTIENVPINGATIFLDGDQLTQQTPALISNLAVGSHVVRIRPESDYPPQSDTVEVVAFDTTNVSMRFAPIDTAGSSVQTVFVTSDPPGAQINIGDRAYQDQVTPATLTLVPDDQNSYSLSVYLEGYRTTAPYLYDFFGVAGDTAELEFTLEPHQTGNDVGGLVPDFKLANYQVPADWSDTVTVAEYRGKVVLVNFWFANCVPCREEFPSLQVTYEERYEDGFRILALNTGWYPDDAEDFLEFREDIGLTFPLLYNSIGADLWNENGYNVQGAPTNILVDRSGVIRDRFGATNHDDLNQRIDAVMELTAP